MFARKFSSKYMFAGGDVPEAGAAPTHRAPVRSDRHLVEAVPGARARLRRRPLRLQCAADYLYSSLLLSPSTLSLSLSLSLSASSRRARSPPASAHALRREHSRLDCNSRRAPPASPSPSGGGRPARRASRICALLVDCFFALAAHTHLPPPPHAASPSPLPYAGNARQQ